LAAPATDLCGQGKESQVERGQNLAHLHFIRRYRKRLFAGRLEALGILLVGFIGYLYISSTKYGSTVIDGLLNILASAKLDDCLYRIVDWHQKKGQLLVFVPREFYC
jgi:hypothetical protein